MKANEAPDKIYLLSTPYRMLDGWYRDKSPIPPSFEQVEYARTDVFIEKACEWLKENKDHPFIGCEDPCLSGYLTDGFIEAFKKAMEK